MSAPDYMYVIIFQFSVVSNSDFFFLFPFSSDTYIRSTPAIALVPHPKGPDQTEYRFCSQRLLFPGTFLWLPSVSFHNSNSPWASHILGSLSTFLQKRSMQFNQKDCKSEQKRSCCIFFLLFFLSYCPVRWIARQSCVVVRTGWWQVYSYLDVTNH